MSKIGRLTRRAQQYNLVAAGSRSTNVIQIGKTLEYFRLKMGGTTFAADKIEQIIIRANQRPIWDVTGPELVKLMAYRGQFADAAFLDVPFVDHTGLSEMDRMRGAFDTSNGIQTLTSEVKIAATAVAPTLDGILFESTPQVAVNGVALPFRGEIAQLKRQPYDKASGGKLPLEIAQADGVTVKRIHFFHAGNMTGLEIRIDGMTVHESLAAENVFEQKKFGRVPQTNVYTADFVLDGNVLKALVLSKEKKLEIIPTFSAADNGVMLLECLGGLGAIV